MFYIHGERIITGSRRCWADRAPKIHFSHLGRWSGTSELRCGTSHLAGCLSGCAQQRREKSNRKERKTASRKHGEAERAWDSTEFGRFFLYLFVHTACFCVCDWCFALRAVWAIVSKKKQKKKPRLLFLFLFFPLPALKMSPSFLNSNSTSHIWPFSAVAELVGEDFSISISLFFFFFSSVLCA